MVVVHGRRLNLTLSHASYVCGEMYYIVYEFYQTFRQENTPIRNLIAYSTRWPYHAQRLSFPTRQEGAVIAGLPEQTGLSYIGTI